MKTKGQTHREAFDPTELLISPRHPVRIGAWNVRTMWETGKTAQALKEMKDYKISILGLSETRWTQQGKLGTTEGGLMCWSGRQDDHHAEGVALIMDKHSKKCLMEWKPISSRLIQARFFTKFAKLTIIQCYAPTEMAAQETKEEFYSQLQEAISIVSSHDVLIVMGDLNAKIGSDNSGYERNIGRHGLGPLRNDNGEKFLDLCVENNLVIGGTLFKHKDIHKATWNSPDGRTKNQIDHVAINCRWRSSLQDVKTIRGAELDSDHHLVLCKLKLKLKKMKKPTSPRILDS